VRQFALNVPGLFVRVVALFSMMGFLMSCNSHSTSTSTTGAPGWGTPVLIETNNGTALFPQVAMDSNGNAIAVWMQTDVVTGRTNIWANRYVAETGWDVAQLLETDDTGDAALPRIAVDPVSESGLAVWQQSDGTRTIIMANHFDAASSAWGVAQSIETVTGSTGDAVTPQVAMNSAGNGIAVWRQFEGTQYHIMANTYTAGVGWGTAQAIESNAGDAIAPQVALDSGGNAIAVWRQADGAQINVWVNRYAAGAWGATPQSFVPTDTVTTDTGDAAAPQVAVDPDGDGIVVWQQQQTPTTSTVNPPNDVWATHYSAASSSWDPTPRLLETASGNAINPRIAMDDTGNGLAVWQQTDGARYNIWASRYAAGTGWATAQLIETDDTGNALVPQIAVNQAGNGIATWEQVSGDRRLGESVYRRHIYRRCRLGHGGAYSNHERG